MQRLERIGRRVLSFALGLPISRSCGAYPPVADDGRRDAGGNGGSGERGVRRTRRRAEGTRPRPRHGAGGQRYNRPRRRRGGHRQDTARVRARCTSPRSPGSRSSSVVPSISSARSCRTSRSSRPFVHSAEHWQVERRTAGSQRQAFEETLALLSEPGDRGTGAAGARGSALGRHVDTRSRRLPRPQRGRPTGSAARDLPRRRARASTERMRRFADGVRRSGSALMFELGPLERRRVDGTARGSHRRHPAVGPDRRRSSPVPKATRSSPRNSSPSPADGSDELPHGLRDLLLERVGRLDPATAGPVASGCGRGRRRGVLAASRNHRTPRRATSASRCAAPSNMVFSWPTRPRAASASATRSWRRRSTRRSFPASARSSTPASLRSSPRSAGCGTGGARAATGRRPGARPRRSSPRSKRHARPRPSSAWRKRLAHLERALALWEAVPDAPELAGIDLRRAVLLDGRVSPASTGATPRGRTGQRAIDLVGDATIRLRRTCTNGSVATSTNVERPMPASRRPCARSSWCRRSHPRPNVRRRWPRWGAIWGWRGTSRSRSTICEQALAMARAVGARPAEQPCAQVLGIDLVYLGRADEGRRPPRRAVRLAEQSGDCRQLLVAYVSLTDALTMLARPRGVDQRGRGRARRHPPLRDRQHGTRVQLHRSAGHDAATGTRRTR